MVKSVETVEPQSNGIIVCSFFSSQLQGVASEISIGLQTPFTTKRINWHKLYWSYEL